MSIAWWVFGILIGSLVEWLAHKYVLHNFTLKLLSKTHFGVHHKNSRKNNCLDRDYLRFPPTKLSSGLSEIIMLVLLGIVVIPVFFYSIPFFVGLEMHIIFYYVMHRQFHLNPSWGKKWMRCHWDHHMGKNQNANWGVTNPFFDYVFGTRVLSNDPY